MEFAGNSFANSWADSKTDGLANLNAILNNQFSSVSYFPAQKWCNDKGAGWYLPAVDEMTEILNNIDKLNTAISDHNGTKLTKGYNYWTSTQNTETKDAWSAAWDWDKEGVVTSERSSTLTGNARASYNVSLKTTTTDPDKPVESAYKIGDEMKVDNGHGVVAYIDETGEHGYIISKLECEAVKWATTGNLQIFGRPARLTARPIAIVFPAILRISAHALLHTGLYMTAVMPDGSFLLTNS